MEKSVPVDRERRPANNTVMRQIYKNYNTLNGDIQN